MVRSLWIGTLAAALSCSAPGWSQVLQQDRWIMVREEGKPAVKCRVVRTWKEKDGTTICKARTESGQTITLMEEPVNSSTGKGCMRIVKDDYPPTVLPGVPVPPRPMPSQLPQPVSETNLKPVPAPTIEHAVVKPTPVKPKEAPPTLWGRLFGEKIAPTKDTASATKPPALTGAEKSALTSSRPLLPLAGPTKEDPLNRPELYTKTPSSMAITKETTPTPLAGQTASAKPVAKKEPGLIGRLFGRSDTPSPQPKTTITQASTAPLTPAPMPMSVTSAPKTVSLPPGTRAVKGPSFFDRLRGQVAAKRAEAKAPKSDPRAGMLPGMGSILAANDQRVASQSAAGMHMVRMPDGTMTMVSDEMVPQGANSVPVSANNAFTLSMPGGGMPQGMAMMPGGGMPQGMAMMPGGGMQQGMGMMPSGGMQQGMPMMAMQQPPAIYDRGIPAGAANAFTRTSSTRPIPADFGPTPQAPNAFQVDGMGGAYARPPMAPGCQPGQGYGPGAGPSMMTMQPPTGQMLGLLRGSMLPSDRERAAEALSLVDWRFAPEAVAALVVSAKTDPAPMVRAGCVRALARMKVNTQPVFQALLELKTDKDVRVRQEAEQTLVTMSSH